MTTAEIIKVEQRPIGDLIPFASNARTHSEAQVAQIAASIREFGWTNPILVGVDNGIIAGHGRLLAARQLGMGEVPVIVLDHLTDVQKRALVIADNKLALNAGWDLDLLGSELKGLSDDGFNLDLIGFSGDELADLLADRTEGLTDPDDVPEPPADPVSVPGDVWVMGRHRLVCGDAMEVGAVDAALQGRKADICLTDPPYGLDEKKQSGKNNYRGYDDTLANLKDLAAAWLPLARAHSVSVVFSSGVTRQWLYPEPDWVICWYYAGGPARSPWGYNCWQPFLCYGKDPSLAHGRGARPDAVDLNVSANAGDIDHPCPKPVKLWEWMMARLVFSPNAVIFEPFCGSGTTLIAAEKTGLAVAAIELSPAYVDVAITRWQNFTGKQATHEDGRLFDDLREPQKVAA